MNKLTGWKESVDRLYVTMSSIDDKLAKVSYWLNPHNLMKEFSTAINSSGAENFFIIFTMFLCGLMILGAKWPKKVIFWGWVIYWFLKVVLPR